MVVSETESPKCRLRANSPRSLVNEKSVMSFKRVLVQAVQAMVTPSGSRREAKSSRRSGSYRSPFLFEQLESRQLMAVTMDVDGWTVVTPSADSRVIYVSSSEGNDTNDGLSAATAKATLAGGQALLREGYPDHLLLKSGDTWTEETIRPTWQDFATGGRSADEPILISSYGSGDRPRIVNQDVTGIQLVYSAGLNYVYVIGLHLDGSTRESDDVAAGVRIAGSGGNFHFEDNLIDGFGSAISTNGGTYEDITIRRNILINSWNLDSHAHSQGVYMDAVDNLLIEENIFDHNGWNDSIEGAEATAFNHNMYITHNNRDVVIRNNIISRASSAGLKFQPNDGTHYVVNNLFVKNPIVGTIGGGQESGVIEGQGAVIYWDNNVMVEPEYQGAGGFTGLTSSNLEGGSFRNNILAHASETTGFAYRSTGWESQGVGVNNFAFSGNVIHDWRGEVYITDNAESFTFTNNIIEEPNEASGQELVILDDADSFAAISGNQYYGSQTEGDWFDIEGVDGDHSDWVTATGETGSSSTQLNFIDPTRSATTYATSLGYATYDDFIEAVTQQSKSNRDENFSADTINNYIREGFQIDTVAVLLLPSPSIPTSSSFVPPPSFVPTQPIGLVSGDTVPVLTHSKSFDATSTEPDSDLLDGKSLLDGEPQDYSKRDELEDELEFAGETISAASRHTYQPNARKQAFAERLDSLAW